MAQITIYLDSETERKMKAVTANMQLSQSKWIANLIKDKLRDDWPDSVRQLSGVWKDMPSAEEIGKEMGKDTDREKL